MSSGAAETLRGRVVRTFFSSPDFSAGVLSAPGEGSVTFAGKVSAAAGEELALKGKWTEHPKYGRQFKVEGASYDLPRDPQGLRHYLRSTPAFRGIGEVTAEKLVALCMDRYDGDFNAMVNAEGFVDIAKRVYSEIPVKSLTALKAAWNERSELNDVSAYLAGYELTPHQIGVLIERFGTGIVGILTRNPYEIIQYVEGYGFKTVDKIARRMGTPKEHPGRIRAGVLYCLHEAIRAGNTCAETVELAKQANETLVLDGLNSMELVCREANALVASGEIAVVGDGLVTTGKLLADGDAIHHSLQEHSGQSIGQIARLPLGLIGAQQIAFTGAMRDRIFVITGGAGTGKTHVIGQVVKDLQAANQRVILCAPTGKAAKRMEELLWQRYGLRARASTIHRLLGYNGMEFQVERVEADVLIVDEFSMVDVPLFARLLERLDLSKTRLVLVGDHNQLPPVGPGMLMRDLRVGRHCPVVVLDQVVRQAGVLKQNSVKVLDGTVAPGQVDGQEWIVVDSFKEAHHIQDYMRGLLFKRIPDKLGFDPLTEVQVLTPTHKGLLGTKALNEIYQAELHGGVSGRFAVGDKVIQTKNDYHLDVMNGHQGIVKEVVPKLVVHFEGQDVPQTIEPKKCKHVELAYVLTAHKAQGSEWPCVVVVLHKSHIFADRNWLYTAVTRASKTCIIVGDRWGIREAARRNRVPNRKTLLSLAYGKGE